MATPSIRPNPNFNSQQTAELLRKAMKGFGCDKGKIIQAIVNCSNVQRQEVGWFFRLTLWISEGYCTYFEQ